MPNSDHDCQTKVGEARNLLQELSHANEELRQVCESHQEARNNMADEYEDLYDAHQVLSITLQDAETRQDEDAKVLFVRNKHCAVLEAEGVRSRARIEEMELALADSGAGSAASVRWWKERCRELQAGAKALEGRLANLSDEVCPLMCERLFTHRMQCCQARICRRCLDSWGDQGCPYCRTAPTSAQAVHRLGTARNPIGIL